MIQFRVVGLEEVLGVCDRCKQSFRGLVTYDRDYQNNKVQYTSGFYDVTSGSWKDYAKNEEEHICDACMKSDPQYQEEFGD